MQSCTWAKYSRESEAFSENEGIVREEEKQLFIGWNVTISKYRAQIDAFPSSL